jgi:tetratricopeptide (TPR) repeat protein
VVEALAHGRERIADELEDQPEVRASLLDAIGRTYTGLGRYETADTLLEESLELKRSLSGGGVQVAAGLGFLALNHRLRRNFPEADSLWHEELRLRTGAGPVADTTLATLLGSLSNTRRELGDLDSALALASQAVSVLETAGSEGAHRTSALQHLAFVLRGAQLLDSAEAVYREVLRRQGATAGTSPLTVAVTYNNLGYLQRVREDFATAEASYREAIRLATPLLSDGHAELRLYRNNLASVLEHQGKLDEVEQILAEDVGRLEREWPDGHWRVGSGHMALATFLVRHGRVRQALPHLEAGIRSWETMLGPGHTWTVTGQARLGAALLLANRAGEARRWLDRSYAVLRSRRANLREVQVMISHMATSLEAGGHAGEAARFRDLLPPA